MTQTRRGGRAISLAEVAHEVRGLNSSVDTEPLKAVAAAEDLEIALADPAALLGVCERLADVAEQRGCHQLLGASPVGNRLAAGVVAMGHNGLRLFHRTEQAGGVLVVDGLLVTGSQVVEASKAALSAGASKVCAVVVLSARPGSPGTFGTLSEPVIVLEN